MQFFERPVGEKHAAEAEVEEAAAPLESAAGFVQAE